MVAPTPAFKQQSFLLASLGAQSSVGVVHEMVEAPITFAMLFVQVLYDLRSSNFGAVECLDVIHDIVFRVDVGSGSRRRCCH